jgi:mRNA interferase MazF
VVVERGQVWWADLGEPDGSEPGYNRPVLIVQSDVFNRSRLQTVIAVVLSTNARLVDAPGNVLLPARATGLPKSSVANVSQIITVDRDFLMEPAGRVRGQFLKDVENGLRLVLGLSSGRPSAGAR